MPRVKVLTPSVQASLRRVEGVPGLKDVQAVEFMVVDGEDVERHLCANVVPAGLNDEARLVLTQQLQAMDAALSVCVRISNGQGEARLFRAPDQPGSALGAAAAFACFKALWGWDESEVMRIEVNAQAVRLRMSPRDAEGWLPCNVVALDAGAR